MKMHFKSKPDDLQLAANEKMDAVERSSALARLRFDGFTDIESLFVKLLKHPSFLLRRDAVVTLIGFWQKAEFIETALKMLADDADESVRSGAAFALGEFAARTGASRDYIARGLVKQLKLETQIGAQEECYQALMKIIAPDKIRQTTPIAFKRERDVDWNLLSPYSH